MQRIALLLAGVAYGDARRTTRKLTSAEVRNEMDSLATLLLASHPSVSWQSRNLPRSAVASMMSKEVGTGLEQSVEQTISSDKFVNTKGFQEKPPSPEKKKKLKQKAPKQKVKGPQSLVGSLAPERTFWEGAPSITETLIPGISIFTVIGIIPFGASIMRQAWTRYKISSRRFISKTGWQGKDEVQFIWKEVEDIKWLRRFGGTAGDFVFSLRDGSRVEVRSVPEFERNLAFVMSMVDPDMKAKLDPPYPDPAALDYLAKVAAGQELAPTFEAKDKEAAAKSD
jgi:hypothetical protein|mmetsp:Transcript_71557/g.113387  ORF Transcript_71557/g.113387 Transcript_71557/m.113387 type:complete len:283 (-) Transcript_71557:92-940(-)